MSVSVGDVIAIVELCMKTADKIKNKDDLLEDVASRLKYVLRWLERVEQHFEKIYPNGKYPPKDEVQSIATDMRTRAKKVETILKKYVAFEQIDTLTKIGRAILFVIGSSGKELEGLMTKLEQRTDDLWREVDFDDIANHRPRITQVNQPLTGTVKQRKVNILFVDPGNTGRSVVAHAYALLVKEWTLQSKGPWFINNVHSAGLYIRKPNGLAAQQDQLKWETRQAFVKSGEQPMKSLFDNKLFNEPYKQTVRAKFQARKSHGLPDNMFKDFDYIFVFTYKDHTQIQKLRRLTRQTIGDAFVPNGKAHIVMLGEYRGGRGGEIWGPKKVNGEMSLSDWLKCTAQIKTAFKGWLKEELGWKQPDYHKQTT